MKRFAALTAVALLSALLAPSATASTIEGVRFAKRIDVGEAALRLHGTGLLRYRIFIKGYVAALYLDESFVAEPDPSTVLGDTARRLEIEYFWSIRAEDFARATRLGMARNTAPAALESMAPRIEQINALYRDVDPGDRYALTYLPGVGTELALNGRSLGVVEGDDFAAALFAIWIGERPLDEALRDQLLVRQ